MGSFSLEEHLEGLPGVCTDPVGTGARLGTRVMCLLLCSPRGILGSGSQLHLFRLLHLPGILSPLSSKASPGLPVAFVGSDPHSLSRPKILSTISYTRGNWLGGGIARPKHLPPLEP